MATARCGWSPVIAHWLYQIKENVSDNSDRVGLLTYSQHGKNVGLVCKRYVSPYGFTVWPPGVIDRLLALSTSAHLICRRTWIPKKQKKYDCCGGLTTWDHISWANHCISCSFGLLYLKYVDLFICLTHSSTNSSIRLANGSVIFPSSSSFRP